MNEAWFFGPQANDENRGQMRRICEKGASAVPRLRDSFRMVGLNEAACAADASREVVERWLPGG
jgi:hypothetical protein